MTWGFRSAGTIGTSFNAVMTPGAPAGFQAGDILALFAWCVPGTVTIPSVSGFTQLSPNVSFTDCVIWGKPATGGDTMPSLQLGPDFQGCCCLAYTGGSITASRTGVERGTNSTSGVSFAAYSAPPDNNVLVLGLAVRGSGSATGLTFGSSGAYNTRVTQTVNSRPRAIIIDQIQTTAASGSLLNISTSPADSASLAAASQLIFLLPSAATFNPVPPLSLGGMNVQVCQ